MSVRCACHSAKAASHPWTVATGQCRVTDADPSCAVNTVAYGYRRVREEHCGSACEERGWRYRITLGWRSVAPPETVIKSFDASDRRSPYYAPPCDAQNREA